MRSIDSHSSIVKHHDNVLTREISQASELSAITKRQRHDLEKTLVRKIDIRIVPMMMLLMFMKDLSRDNIFTARFAGLEDDIDLDARGRFSTVVNIHFVGHILWMVPSNLILHKIGKPGKYLPACLAGLGALCAATAACQTYEGLVAIRFFFGFMEAIYFPGCLYYLSRWYTRRELTLRTACLYSGMLTSRAFTGSVAAAILREMDGAGGLSAWRWLFLIEGVATIVMAVLGLLVMPDFPQTTKWLSQEEAALSLKRLEDDIGEDKEPGAVGETFWSGFIWALQDVKTWLLMPVLFGTMSAASVTDFFPAVLEDFGFGRVATQLLLAPPYLFGVTFVLGNAWHADKTGERFCHIAAPLCMAILAFIIAAATTDTAARYTSMMLMVPGIYGAYTIGLTWSSNTLKNPAAKRAAGLALIDSVAHSSNIYSGYLYSDWAYPTYTGAFVHNCLLAALAIAGALVLRSRLATLNKKLDSEMEGRGEEGFGSEMEEAAKKSRKYVV